MYKGAPHEQVNIFPSQLPVLHSNLSLVSGNTSFPEETKLLLYHSGPQVFQCSLTVACKPRKEGTSTGANLSQPRTNALCNPSPFLKRQQGALSLNLFPTGMLQQFAQPNVPDAQWDLVCLHDIESWPHFAIAAVGLGAHGANKDQRTNVFHMPAWPPGCWGQPQRLGKDTGLGVASGFTKFAWWLLFQNTFSRFPCAQACVTAQTRGENNNDAES